MKETESKKIGKFIAELPRAVKIFYALGIISIFLFCAYIISEPFADFFNRYVSSTIRFMLAKLTDVIPFSLAELLVLFAPAALIAAVLWAASRFSSSWRQVGVFCASLLSVISLLFSVFIFSFVSGYHGAPLERKLGIERRDSTTEELYYTAEKVLSFVNAEAENVIYRADGFSIMPYTYNDMSTKLADAFSRICGEYSFISPLRSRVKPVMLSKAMSYSHITGLYSFFTGEANINTDFPDYTIPYTAAHELAHQRGIAREDEANFIAYLVCISSDDAYIRYSGYLNMYEYLLSPLRRADTELYQKSLASLSVSVLGELRAYAAFFSKYEDSTLSDFSETVNDVYLTIQGTGGTASYGMVVDLTVGYYRDR